MLITVVLVQMPLNTDWIKTISQNSENGKHLWYSNAFKSRGGPIMTLKEIMTIKYI
jgi:hypothetical protein